LLRMSMDLPDEAQTVPLCRKTIRAVLQELDVDPDRAFEIELVVSEAAANVIRHAYAHPGNRYLVCIEIHMDRMLLQVEDHGRGFSHAAVPPPDEEQFGGRGIWLIEQLAEVAHFRTPSGGGCRMEAEFALRTPSPERSECLPQA
jgi:anti-sigma regulatory factor (Ser/Thr protein kinase)